MANAAAELVPVLPAPEWLADGPAPVLLTPAPAPRLVAAGPGRRVVQAGVALFCGFLVMRTLVVEPFGVPTGSMAAALLGNHREAGCPRCGARVLVGEPAADGRAVRWDRVACPNCAQPVDLTAAAQVAGDRLLVDKTVFHARPPRRWEVAVFRCGADGWRPYVKRVVGLPGELVQLRHGDVYADGMLQRKSLAQVRETRLLAFEMAASPPEGWGARWLAEPLADPALPPLPRAGFDRAAGTDVVRGAELRLDPLADPVTFPHGLAVTYRHVNLDTLREEPMADALAYNGPADRKRFAEGAGGHAADFSVRFDLEIVAGSGAFTCTLTDGADRVSVELPLGRTGEAVLTVAGHAVAPTRGAISLAPGRTYTVEAAFVDRRLSVAIDGREVAAPLDLPADPTTLARLRGGGVSRPVRLGVAGAAVVVRDLRIERDIHYIGVGKPPGGWALGPKEFFVLGDNTADSHDSRAWQVDGRPAPGVPAHEFLGKPVLIHQPLKLARLSVSGRERTFQTPDWGRIRWLR